MPSAVLLLAVCWALLPLGRAALRSLLLTARYRRQSRLYHQALAEGR
jgi:hypothetical protein